MSKPIDLDQMRKVLLVRADRMGDVVLTTPVFSAIKEQRPDWKVGVLVSREYGDLVRANPFVDEVFLYDKDGSEKSLLGNWRFISRLRKSKYDAAVHFHPRSRMHWISFLAGIPVRIGYRHKNFRRLTHRLPYDKPKGGRHEAECNFDLLKLLGIEKPGALKLHVPLQEEFRASVETKLASLKRFVVVHPSASSPSKIWLSEYFSQVADHIFERFKAGAVLIGSTADQKFTEAVKSRMKSEPLDLTGRLGVGELPWLFKKAKLVISNDTGPAHVAAAVGTPVLSIFGRNRPGLGPDRWRPMGPASYFLQKDVGCAVCPADLCKIDFKCLKELTPEEVKRWLDAHVEIFSG